MKDNEFYLNYIPEQERTKETQPDYRAGKPVVIDGKKYWFSGWSGKNSIGPYLKVSINQVIDDGKYQQKQAQQVPEVPETDDFNEDIPF